MKHTAQMVLAGAVKLEAGEAGEAGEDAEDMLETEEAAEDAEDMLETEEVAVEVVVEAVVVDVVEDVGIVEGGEGCTTNGRDLKSSKSSSRTIKNVTFSLK